MDGRTRMANAPRLGVLYLPMIFVQISVAAESRGVPMIVSAFTNYPIDEIRAAAPNAVLWQNVYLWRNLTKNAEFIERAERLNFKAIVVSVDIATLSYRRMGPLGDKLDEIPEAHFTPKERLDNSDGCPDATWDAFYKMTRMTTLPVIAKGVLTAKSARLAMLHGAKGVIVSNHGGRQLDGVPASVSLPCLLQYPRLPD